MTSASSDSEQAACQHAMSPPFGHSNSQGRAGHCCSPGDLLAPTWPRRLPNTPTAVTTQRLKSSVAVSPGHTSLRNKRRGKKGRRWKRLDLGHQGKESSDKKEGKEEGGKIFCSLAARREEDGTKRDEPCISSAEQKGGSLTVSHTHGLKDTHAHAPRSCCTHLST